MSEPIRLVCPDCDTVHRVKQVTLGKLYRCKKCRTGLVTLSQAVLACPRCGAATPPGHVDVSRLVSCAECGDGTALTLTFPMPEALPPESPARLPSDEGVLPATDGGGGLTEDEIRSLLRDTLEVVLDARMPPPDETTGEADDEPPIREVVADALDRRLSTQQEEWGQALLRQEERLLGSVTSALREGRQDEYDLLASTLQTREQEVLNEFTERLRETVSRMADDLAEGSMQYEQRLSRLLESQLEALNTRAAERESQAGERDRQLVEAFGARMEAALDRQVLERVESVVQSGLDTRMRDAVETAVADLPKTLEERCITPMAVALEARAPEIVARLQSEEMEKRIQKVVRDVQEPLVEEIQRGRGAAPWWLVMLITVPFLPVFGYLIASALSAQDTAETHAGTVAELTKTHKKQAETIATLSAELEAREIEHAEEMKPLETYRHAYRIVVAAVKDMRLTPDQQAIWRKAIEELRTLEQGESMMQQPEEK